MGGPICCVFTKADISRSLIYHQGVYAESLIRYFFTDTSVTSPISALFSCNTGGLYQLRSSVFLKLENTFDINIPDGNYMCPVDGMGSIDTHDLICNDISMPAEYVYFSVSSNVGTLTSERNISLPWSMLYSTFLFSIDVTVDRIYLRLDRITPV